MKTDVKPIDVTSLLANLNSDAKALAEWCGPDSLNLQLLKTLIATIERRPVLDYAPVIHAHWILTKEEEGYSYCLCSHCNESHGKELIKFCPNCGARMDEPYVEVHVNEVTGRYEKD